MKSYKLKIEKEKTQINEVDVNLDKILKTTGVGETFTHMLDLTKVVTANAKLLLDTILAFRSLDWKQITNNLNKAIESFAKRVRNAMGNTDKIVDKLSEQSYVQEALMFTMPVYSFVDYYRRQIDSSGGIKNFLEKDDQIFNVGNSVSSLYGFVEEKINSSLDVVSNNPEVRLQDYGKGSAKNEIRDFFRQNFGPNAEEVVNDFLSGNETNHTQSLDRILNSNADSEVISQQVYGYFQNLDPTSTNESNLIKTKKIYLFERKVDKSKSLKFISLLAYSLYKNHPRKIIYAATPIKDIEIDTEERLKEDIEVYESFLSYLLNIVIVRKFAEDIFDNKGTQINIEQIIDTFITKSRQDNFKKMISDMGENKSKLSDEEFKASVLMLLDTENYNDTKKIGDYLTKYSKYSNSNNSDFVNLKQTVERLNKYLTDNTIDSVVSNLQSELKKGSNKDEL